MAKALVLSEDILAAPVDQPRAAAQTARVAAPAPKAARPPKVPRVPLQVRIPAADAKAIKRAALDADQTISDFMLACFHASIKQ
jgi:hypothetical protein